LKDRAVYEGKETLETVAANATKGKRALVKVTMMMIQKATDRGDWKTRETE